MTHEERIAALQDRGYGPRQAAFLALVMRHGGYFVRRQVDSFFHRQDGGVATAFLRHVVLRRHARVAVYRRRTHVYHVYARPLYATIGEAHNRNRRAVAPAEIVRKVMTVDLVLHTPHTQFLATEREKVAYLTDTCHVPAGVFPATWFGSQHDLFRGVVRYFVDKAPMFVAPPTGTISIAYVQGLDTTLTGFRTFLDTYARLLSALPRAWVVLCAPDPWVCDRAHHVMATWRRAAPARHAAGVTRLREQLTAYCVSRHRLEVASGFASHADRRIVRHCHGLVAGPRFEGLYERWRACGPSAIDRQVSQEAAVDVSRVAFTSQVFPYRYELFGTVLAPVCPRCHRRPDPRSTPSDVAGSSSPPLACERH
jgi:hypothetical protein